MISLRWRLHRGADLVELVSLRLEGQVDGRDVRRRHAERHAGQLALERRSEGTALAAPVLDGMMFWCASSAVPVLLSRAVHGRLRRGHRVHRRHQPFLQAELFVDDLRDRRQAVGGAACLETILSWPRRTYCGSRPRPASGLLRFLVGADMKTGYARPSGGSQRRHDP